MNHLISDAPAERAHQFLTRIFYLKNFFFKIFTLVLSDRLLEIFSKF
jgi:hypothetical protein